jgi:hypothetical protein
MEVLCQSRAVLEGVFTVVRGMFFEGSRHAFLGAWQDKGIGREGLFIIRFRSDLREV